ncbi:hypothetical protein BN439_2815 [Erwinia amylovora Ea644]|nr:hypothetical protein BN439_2815 [Erwinia amylovora Ea644]CCP07922.1 hypothetical protein BN440_2909 [Erwinia amylovora MR1]
MRYSWLCSRVIQIVTHHNHSSRLLFPRYDNA